MRLPAIHLFLYFVHLALSLPLSPNPGAPSADGLPPPILLPLSPRSVAVAAAPSDDTPLDQFLGPDPAAAIHHAANACKKRVRFATTSADDGDDHKTNRRLYAEVHGCIVAEIKRNSALTAADDDGKTVSHRHHSWWKWTIPILMGAAIALVVAYVIVHNKHKKADEGKGKGEGEKGEWEKGEGEKGEGEDVGSENPEGSPEGSSM